MRNKEKPLTSAVNLANLLLPVVATRLLSTPYVVRSFLEDLSSLAHTTALLQYRCAEFSDILCLCIDR